MRDKKARRSASPASRTTSPPRALMPTARAALLDAHSVDQRQQMDARVLAAELGEAERIEQTRAASECVARWRADAEARRALSAATAALDIRAAALTEAQEESGALLCRMDDALSGVRLEAASRLASMTEELDDAKALSARLARLAASAQRTALAAITHARAVRAAAVPPAAELTEERNAAEPAAAVPEAEPAATVAPDDVDGAARRGMPDPPSGHAALALSAVGNLLAAQSAERREALSSERRSPRANDVDETQSRWARKTISSTLKARPAWAPPPTARVRRDSDGSSGSGSSGGSCSDAGRAASCDSAQRRRLARANSGSSCSSHGQQHGVRSGGVARQMPSTATVRLRATGGGDTNRDGLDCSERGPLPPPTDALAACAASAHEQLRHDDGNAPALPMGAISDEGASLAHGGRVIGNFFYRAPPSALPAVQQCTSHHGTLC